MTTRYEAQVDELTERGVRAFTPERNSRDLMKEAIELAEALAKLEDASNEEEFNRALEAVMCEAHDVGYLLRRLKARDPQLWELTGWVKLPKAFRKVSEQEAKNAAAASEGGAE